MNKFYSDCIFYDENDNLLNDFALNVEEGSRYLIERYIKNDDCVLELGARYGTVSVCIDYILNDSIKQQLSVDPDVNIISCLNKNRSINSCNFNIFNGAISNQPLYVCYNGCGWETKTYVDPPKNLNSILVPTKTLSEIQNEYNIFFNVLLADCEGFLLYFIRENTDFFDQLRCVIYEEDCDKYHPINNEIVDYNEVENFLLSKGFFLVETYVDFIGLNNKVWLKK